MDGIKIDLKVQEVKNPEISATLVANRIAGELERRMPARRTATKTMDRVMQSGAKGIKIVLGGRIQGADICSQSPDGSRYTAAGKRQDVYNGYHSVRCTAISE